MSSHLFLIYSALIDTVWSTAVHPKGKYPGSALLHCSLQLTCLYVASSGGHLAEGCRPSPIYHLHDIKSLIPTVCLHRMPAFIVYSLHLHYIGMLSLKLPLMFGSWSSEYIKISHWPPLRPSCKLLCVSASKLNSTVWTPEVITLASIVLSSSCTLPFLPQLTPLSTGILIYI